ncbi:hypothetical protein B5M09_010496 [Aphanomyces astaci]|uniref:Uncharacterized protein n=1 Tax=Aphanomyces astaci TaxID=112090 RepID=A0A3R7X5I1_APHAT|nr:hypothetical protein B5M09_010496 [Aphanomyces astaci]
MCMDYIRLAGINSFSLLPQELKREGPVPTDDDDDEADHLRRKNAIADARGGTVLYANALDKLYEAGVLKLSKGQVFLCHQLLSQRAVRFNEVYMLPFEGYKDMSACIAYYPHDMDMYWYRGHLHQRYHNYDAAIDDLTSVCEYIWIRRDVDGDMYKKMVLARATLYTHEMQWELALDDLNEVLHYALKDNHVETSFLLHVYDKRCKVLVALKQYDAAIVVQIL